MNTPEAAAFLHPIFDERLDRGASAGFDVAVGVVDRTQLMDFVETSGYPRAEAIKEAIVEASVDAFLKNMASKSAPAEFAYGCRHPKSRPGSWDRAFVAAGTRTGDIVSAVFDDGMDYVGHLATEGEAEAQYREFISRDYVPMTPEDVTKTSGIDIDEGTRCAPLHGC